MIQLFDWFSLPLMLKKYKPAIRVKIGIEGPLNDVLADVMRYRPQNCTSLVTIRLKVKSAGGSWTEDYDLPVLNSPNTIPAKTVLEGLYRQGRIEKEQFEEANTAIDKLAHCANEASAEHRYAKRSMTD